VQNTDTNTASVWTVLECNEGEPAPWFESYRSFEAAFADVREDATEKAKLRGLGLDDVAEERGLGTGPVRVFVATFDDVAEPEVWYHLAPTRLVG
jgi:hypothetical protein